MTQDRPSFDLDNSNRPSSPEAEESSEVTGRVTSGMSYGGLAAAALVVVAIIGLLSVIGGSDDEEAAAPSSTADTPATSSLSPQPAPVPETAGEPEERAAEIVPPTTLVPGQFLLGEPTGLWLFYGGVDPLQRLDLDDGGLIEYGLESFPVEATGDDLVLHQGGSSVSGWVLASDPGEQALNWKRGPVAPGPEPGQLWVLDPNGEMEHPSGEAVGYGRWQLFDLGDNRVVDRRPGDLYDEVEAELANSPLGALASRYRAVGPDYSNRPDGVYRYGEVGYNRIADGRALAADGSTVLVTTCDETSGANCQTAWLDWVTGERVGKPAPDGDVRAVRMTPSGSLLLATDAAGVTSLIDMATGIVDVLDEYQSVAVSPDARWLAGLTADALIIEDLMGVHPPLRYELLRRVNGGTLLLVER